MSVIFEPTFKGNTNSNFPSPTLNSKLNDNIDVRLPNLEFDNSRQDAQQLRNLAQDTGGTYYSIQDAITEIPKRLPNRGETISHR